MVPKAVESHPLVDSMRSLIGERMSIKMYEQNIAKANSSSAVHRMPALSRNVSFSVIVTINLSYS
jgi:hypothetical protein